MNDLHIGLEGIISAIGAVVGVIVWLVRLEGKTNTNEKEILRLDTRMTALEGTVVGRLGSIEQSLARLEGRLSHEDRARERAEERARERERLRDRP